MLTDRGNGSPGKGALWRTLRRARVVLIGCIAVLCAVTARADDDLPGRVARVANVQGLLHHATDERAGEWLDIGQNDPIAQGDNLYVDRDGVAEIDYGGGQFRLAGETNLHVSRLDDRQLALFIAAGRVIVRVRVLEPDDSVRIDTPATQIALRRPGLYRIDVATASPLTSVIVREGEAQVATPTGIETVWPGQIGALTGAANEPIDIRSGGGLDGFDTWSAARDRVYETPRQNAYVSRQMIGEVDLDAHGAWQSLPEYGAVWFPTVDPAWAPYRFGHWTWLSGWGYTWVDLAPWGYAPFHYGRWAYIGGRWGWCPGAFVARPLWAPALVAWYGGGTGWHGAHGPVYGWVPLGWREPFLPWWNHCTDRCFARYNRPYAVNVAERASAAPTHYANWRVPGGITAVSGSALMTGGPVGVNRVAVRADGSAFTPLAQPPAFKPHTPVRPALRAARPLPAPASTLMASSPALATAPSGRSALPPAASAGSLGGAAIAPAAPPVGYRAGATPASRLAAAMAPGASAPVRDSEPRSPLRIDDGRSVLPPTPRPVPTARVTAPVAPSAVERFPVPSRALTTPVTSPSMERGTRAAVPQRTVPTTVPPPLPQAGLPPGVPHTVPPIGAPTSLPAPVPPVSPTPIGAARRLPTPVPPVASPSPPVGVAPSVVQPAAPVQPQRTTPPGRPAIDRPS